MNYGYWGPGFSLTEKEPTNEEKGQARMNTVVVGWIQRY